MKVLLLICVVITKLLILAHSQDESIQQKPYSSSVAMKSNKDFGKGFDVHESDQGTRLQVLRLRFIEVLKLI